jgi:hypothetical protein
VYFLKFAEKVTRILDARSHRRWPDNIVPYVIDAGFTTSGRAIIAAVNIFIAV